MPSFKILSTNHTSFTVRDLDRSVAFFRDALGFEVTSKAPRDPAAIAHITGVQGAGVLIAYVRGPDHSLELIEYTAPPERGQVQSRPCDVGFAHLAFDVDDVDAAIAASRAHGFEPINPPYVIDKGPNTGARVVYLRDPDGITIEFIEKR
ncbi:MAG: VOC family protein [Gammaproteobacteria bacterium]|nr:VOC family protein [Gammaproteobacteria bacterium]